MRKIKAWIRLECLGFKPSTGTAKPSTGTEKPSTGTTKPSTGTQNKSEWKDIKDRVGEQRDSSRPCWVVAHG